LRQLVREHHLEDHVDFLGVRNDLPTLMRAADLFVLCSETEGLPNVVLEAMGVGTPAVVSPGAGCNDLISPGVDGWIVPDWNVASWVEIIRQVLSDADTRLCVGQNAREKIRNHFRVEQMVSRMAEVYKKILN
jgi:glycosyltransferase involved in cell wall biosynthesis